LIVERDKLRRKVDALEAEVAHWRDKYYAEVEQNRWKKQK
jgi:hypothetical protein